jgi:hypothetical protein
VIYAPNASINPGSGTVRGAIVDSSGSLNGPRVHDDEVLGGATCP